MPDYKTAAASLPEAMRPLRDYCARQRTKPDLSSFAFQHVQHIEGAMEAFVTFFKAAEERLVAPSSTEIILRTRRHLAECGYLLDYTFEERADLSEYAQAFALYGQPHLTFPTITSHE